MPDSKPFDSKRATHSTPLLGVVGFSGSGKTTLLTRLIAKLNQTGLRIGVIKHAHHSFDIDQPGKDSYVLRHAGAGQTLVASKNRWALMVETPDNRQDPQLNELLERLDSSRLDLILVEGFKHVSYPKLEVHRAAVNPVLLYPDDPDIMALLTDNVSQFNDTINIPVLNLDDTISIVQFILNFIRNHNDR
jgi:molybdopterin-guanine dinucleotide biosynthesis protein B